MTAMTFALVLLVCGPNTGCTEIPQPGYFSHIECLMAGAEAVQNGLADKFRCRFEQGQET